MTGTLEIVGVFMLTTALALSSIFIKPLDLPLLSPVFGDHMVIQREKPNRFWGWTTPFDTVTVELAGRKVSGQADRAGRWSVMIAPPLVGGPYELKVSTPDSEETLSDLLVGDVWICSGQSNMEMGISQVKNSDAEIRSANYPKIRTFIASRAVGYDPQNLIQGEWRVCSPDTIVKDGWGGFSGVGYFFGRKLHRELGVPIGLLATSWGGTSAEAWASRESIDELNDFDDDLAMLDRLKGAGSAPVGTYLDVWMREHDAISRGGIEPQSLGFDSSNWKTVDIPNGFDGIFGKGRNGLAWFKKEFELPDPLPAGRINLKLGSMRLFDWTWVNGNSLGFTGWEAERNYWMWPGSVRPGKNEITIRLMNMNGQGGFLARPENLYVELGDGQKISLSGEWKSAIGKEILADTPLPKNSNVNPSVPTVLYNGMLAPIAPLAIRGAIWYQGESNDGRGYQYRSLLPAMIQSWRKVFKQGDFPFYIVSLANFGQRSSVPGDDSWAEVREAQAMTAAKIKNSGLAVTIDVGEANDIHPRDKQTVGERLALNALAQEFGRKVEYSGPVYKSMRVRNGVVSLTFTHAGGIQFRNGEKGFMIAGSDRKWYWAEAKIENDKVLVSSVSVSNPVAVRYGWGKNPEAGLYNSADLPAVPFRTDNWKLLSQPANLK